MTTETTPPAELGEADEMSPEEIAEYEAESAAVFNLAVRLMRADGNDGDPHEMLYSGGPLPDPWGEAWQRYEDKAKLIVDLIGVDAAVSHSTTQEVAEPVAVVIADGAWKKLAFCSHDIRKAPPVGTKLYATPAAQAATPAAAGDVLDELHRALCGIGVIERKDGYELIRRESVLDLLDRRRTAISTTPGAQT